MESDLILQARNLSKSFPGVKALDDVSLDVERGRVHAVTGENGAGKSTLMKILIGLHAPDSGEILFNGRSVRLRNPHEALRMGISMIHQELLPFRDLTVAENIWMGQEPTRWLPGWLDKPAMNRGARRLLERLGVRLPPVTQDARAQRGRDADGRDRQGAGLPRRSHHHGRTDFRALRAGGGGAVRLDPRLEAARRGRHLHLAQDGRDLPPGGHDHGAARRPPRGHHGDRRDGRRPADRPDGRAAARCHAAARPPRTEAK